MDSKKFEELCKMIIAGFIQAENKKVTHKDIYTVWLCKTLQNSKGLFSTDALDGRYYEVTYNGDKNEMYVDAYQKTENKVISF